jgi:hypothetical protein
MSNLVIITTYNRPDSLHNLVWLLLEDPTVDIAVFDDVSERLPDIEHPRVTVRINPEHRGKAGFWQTYNEIFAYCREHVYENYILLPDDVEPCLDFVSKAIAAYDAANSVCLSLLVTNLTIMSGISRWGRKPIMRYGAFTETHYFDCCAIVRRNFFDALDWHLDPIPASLNPYTSSGVGRQITLRLQAKGLRMCHVDRTLLSTVDVPSQMNPEERQRHPAYANWRDNSECVDVHMACLWRDGHVLRTAESLMKQPELATLFVTLNNYTQEQYDMVSAGLKALSRSYERKVVIRKGKNKKGSNEKLSQLPKSKAPYIAFADDDIIYPPHHLQYLIQGCNIHNAAVSVHGATLEQFPIGKYYFGDRKMMSWNIALESDTQADIIGTGVGLFRREWFSADELKSLYADAPTTSMDDIIVSCLLSRKDIKRVVLSHPGQYLRTKPYDRTDDYVYDRYKDDDAEQVAYINANFKQ